MVEEMEVKGQRYFKGGQKKGQKRPAQDGIKRRRLDATSVSYFRRVSERLSEGFTEDEEKALFVENVLSEVKGQAVLVSMDMTGSVALERLLSLASPAQVAGVLAELGGETGSEFRDVSCDQCGGHVMESALRQAHRWNGQRIFSGDDAQGDHVLVLKYVCVCVCVCVCVVHLHLCCRSSVCVTDACASATLQTLLTVCHRKRPLLCRKLIKGIMGYLTALSSAPGVSPLLVFLKDPSCSHLMQTVFSCSQKAVLRDVYRSHLRTQLMPLALHPIANYTIQSLITASARFRSCRKSLETLLFLMFLKEVSSAHQACIYLIKNTEKTLSNLKSSSQELYVPLACSSCGSRLLEAVWNSATVSQRQSIAEKLVPSESQLRSDQFARHIWAKFGLTNFMKRRADWQEVQTGESKKRKMFSDILQ
uniref:Nucleolar protein 9 n=1 Tax=Cyprinus carpio TaxID=7962 RepID=A0A8C1SB94_CYPCA